MTSPVPGMAAGAAPGGRPSGARQVRPGPHGPIPAPTVTRADGITGGLPLLRSGITLRAALALFFAYYNFCRVHMTISNGAGDRRTPAMEAGLAAEPWSLGRLLEEAGQE